MEYLKKRDLKGLGRMLKKQSLSQLFGDKPIFVAIKYFPEAIPMFMKNGAVLDVTLDNNTPLMYAIVNSPASIGFLVDAGVDLYKPINIINRTPMTMSANQYPKSLRALIEAGADVNAKDMNGDAPIHVANEDSLKILLSYDETDITVTNGIGNNALHVYAGKSYDMVMELFNSRDVYDVDVVNSYGETAAHIAAKYSTVCLKPLIQVGANINLKDSSGKTVYQVANETSIDFLSTFNKDGSINRLNKQLVMINESLSTSKLDIAMIDYHVIKHTEKYFETEKNFMSVVSGVGTSNSKYGVAEMIVLHDKVTRAQIGRCLVGFHIGVYKDKYLARNVGPMVDLYEISKKFARQGYGRLFFEYIKEYYSVMYKFDRIYAVGIIDSAQHFWKKMGLANTPNLPMDAMEMPL